MVSNIAEDFGITQQVAFEKSVDFFSNIEVTVQPTGIQGKFYKIMRGAQNYVPMAYTSEAFAILKTTGMTGFQIISKSPLTFVGATYIGAIFFAYCGNFINVNLTASNFSNFEFIEIKFNNSKFDFIGVRSIKVSRSKQSIEIEKSSNLEKILKDMNLIISTDQDEIENS